MKKIIFIFLLFSFVASAQTKETITQNRTNQVGIKTKKDFKQQPHVKWFDDSYDNYELNKKTIKKLKKHLKGINIKVFMAVWCHDSHREIPRLYKVLEATNFNQDNLEIIALNRAKKTPANLQEGYNIIHTPTLIFLKNGKEIGRYVEKSRKKLEKDILKIVKGKSYKHSYQ